MQTKHHDTYLLMGLLLEIYNSLALPEDDKDALQIVCKKLLTYNPYLTVWACDNPSDGSNKILSAEGESISLLSTLWDSELSEDNPLTACIHKKQVQYIEKMTSKARADADADADIWQDFMSKAGALTIIAIPLLVGNKCNGALYICSELSGFSRNSMEGYLLALLGQYVSHNREIRIALRKQAKSVKEEIVAQLIFNSINEGIIVTDPQGTIVSVNFALTEITGYSEQELIGNNPRILQSGVHDKDFYRVMWRKVKQYGFWRGEVWNKRKNGEIYPEMLNISSIKAGIEQKVNGYVATLSDISVQKKMENHLHQLAFYDHLTGLPNRVLFKESLKSAIFTAKRNQQRITVLFIDLDHFKNINDTMGHAAGDILLTEATIRIKSSLRESDLLARLGGDEFAVFLQNISSIRDAEVIAMKIIQQLSNVLLITGKEVYISASIGISNYPEDGNTFDELLMNADNAMYRAKQQGRGCCQLYDASMKQHLTKQFKLETDLRSAIDRNQLVLHFQPQVDITNGEVIGVEALLRWQHPIYGLLAPDQFIPIAEQTGMIISMGEWVLHEACATLRHWQDISLPVKRLAVNVSAKQLSNDCLVNQAQSALAKAKCNPESLEIEITESCLLLPKENKLSANDNLSYHGHSEDITSILHKLKKIGIRISIDDFGTGYSNLGLLKNISIDCLKIDKSFIENIFIRNNDKVIVKTIIAMAISLGLEIVAEGVENIQQLAFLIQNQVKIAQGYHFSRPLPKDQFEALIKNPTWNNQSIVQIQQPLVINTGSGKISCNCAS